MDELEQAAVTQQDLSLTFAVASDPKGEVIQSYGVWDEGNEVSWPALFLVDDGVIVWRSIASDFRKRPSVADILSAIDALGEPQSE